MNLDEALPIIRAVETAVAPLGWHVGLTGSVLFKGSSQKDVDIVMYPHDPNSFTRASKEDVLKTLAAAGFLNQFECTAEYVNRPVTLTHRDNQRFDFFWFS